MKKIDKALAYITHGQELLVFRQIHAPEAGIQVPGGTVEPSESPADGVMREAREETGLVGFEFIAQLGMVEHDARPWGRDEIHRRHFFHLRYKQTTPSTWIHFEPDPSILGVELFPCEFYWVKMPDAVPTLIAGQNVFLDTLYKQMETGGNKRRFKYLNYGNL